MNALFEAHDWRNNKAVLRVLCVTDFSKMLKKTSFSD